MEYKIAEHIRMIASLVVMVIDDFTGKVITDGSIRVSIKDAANPVRKSEGYYVFMNLTQKTVQLTITGERYAQLRRTIDLDSISQTEPVVKVRVKPGRNYPFLSGTTSVYGKAEPLSEVRVLCDNVQKYYRLLYDYDPSVNQEDISIFNPENSDMDGKLLVIGEKEENGREIFQILNTKDRENNLYHMEKALNHSYKKIGTKIYPVFATYADENGEYFLPLWNLGDEPADCECEMLGSKSLKEKLSLNIGKMNKLDFTLK